MIHSILFDKSIYDIESVKEYLIDYSYEILFSPIHIDENYGGYIRCYLIHLNFPGMRLSKVDREKGVILLKL